MKTKRLVAGTVFLAAALVATGAGAAELKVLSDGAMKPALEELVKGYQASSKGQVKIDYASSADIEKKIDAGDDYDIIIVDKTIAAKLGKGGKIAIGSFKQIAKKDDKLAFDAGMTNWTDQAVPGNALIAFLATPKAAEVYKAKGLQPG